MADYEMRIIPISMIRPAEYNPRVQLRPGDPDYEKLKNSVDDLGLISPLIWNEQTGNLVGGHQRLQVLIDEGATEAPVFVVRLSEEKEKQANLALNRITGRWDEQKLQEILRGLNPEELSLYGFEPFDVKKYTPEQVDPVDYGTDTENDEMCTCQRCRFRFPKVEV